jgi:hypothetical protein
MGRDESSGARGIASRPVCKDTAGRTVIDDASGTAYVVPTGLVSDLRHLPSGVAAMLARPFPGEGVMSRNADLLVAGLENVLWYAGYVLAAIGVWDQRRRIAVLAFPVACVALIVATGAMTQGNLGTAFRHRGQVAWALAILAVLGARAVARRAQGDPEQAVAAA